jgi:hypothetical protein
VDALYRLDLETHHVTRLPASDGLTSSRVSPDGRYVAALSRDWKRLLLLDNNTATWTELMHVDSGICGYQTWSSDGKYLHLMAFSMGQGFRLMKIRMPDRKLIQIANLKEVAMPAVTCPTCKICSSNRTPNIARFSHPAPNKSATLSVPDPKPYAKPQPVPWSPPAP